MAKPIPHSDITGIFDEELENYLKMNDFRDIHVDKPPIPEERLRDVAGKEMTSSSQAAFMERPPVQPQQKEIPSSYNRSSC
jgi:hypothetical protein